MSMRQAFYETDPTCNHTFQHGLCRDCLCPETPRDEHLADAAFEAYDLLRQQCAYLSEEQANDIAWILSHRTELHAVHCNLCRRAR